ncbi:MAG: SGNH/GDSL hydrolase family protein, partial [Acidobacteriota bacterium]
SAAAWVSARCSYQMNSFGLRGPEFVQPKPDGVQRIYMAGDSFTFGMGVADGDAVMPALVEQKLNASGRTVEVLNGGMLRGSLPRHWRKKWNRISEPFDPDVVLIVFFLRDGTNTGSIPAFFNAIRTEITHRNLEDPVYQSLYLYRLFRDRKDRDLVGQRYTRAFRQAYFGTEEEQKEWHSAQYNVLEIKKAAEARGARVGFVIYPILINLEPGNYPFEDVCNLLEEFAARHGMPTLNLLDSFYGEHGPDLWVSSVDQHPNEKGHVIAADAVTPFVEELLQKP